MGVSAVRRGKCREGIALDPIWRQAIGVGGCADNHDGDEGEGV